MQSIELVGHAHSAVTVSDLDVTIEWYERVLGMQTLFIPDVSGSGIDEVFGEPGTRLRLSKGLIAGTVLEFIEIQHRDALPHPEIPGVLGLVGSVTFYVEDLETARLQAEAAGAEVPPALTDIMGTQVFAIHDPDGLAIEFNKAQ